MKISNEIKELSVSFYNIMLAGALIGIGDLMYLTNENHILGACLFSVGLIGVLIGDFPLFTGRVHIPESFGHGIGLIIMLIGNLLGIGLVAFCCTKSGITFDVEDLVIRKFSQPWYTTLFRAWGCGVMMWLAVKAWKKYKNPIYVTLPIMLFILCGFEHCIANFGYFCIWAFSQDSICQSFNSFDWTSFLCMVLGNAIGRISFDIND